MARQRNEWHDCVIRAEHALKAMEEECERLRIGHLARLRKWQADQRSYEAAADATIDQLRADLAKAQAERNEAQHWRERHCRDSAAYAEQSQKNWQRAEAAEAERDEAQERVRLLEIASAECGLQHETSYTAGTEAMRGAVVQWCAERRLTQWAATFRELPLTPTPTATPDDDVK